MKETLTNKHVARSLQVLRGTLIALVLMSAVLAGVGVNSPAQTTATSQTTPTNKVEAGIGGVSNNSFKFGEYNGLQNQGPFGIGFFDLRGGAAYDSDGTWRWRLRGTNLGLGTRFVFAEFGKQGQFRFNIGYEEILANRSDTFQTPYLGAGTNSLTLPSNWIAPKVPQVSSTAVNFRSFDPIAGTGSVIKNGVLTPPTADQLAALANIRAADVPAFHNVDLKTKRTRIDAGFSYSPDLHWDIPVSFSHEHKEGVKALGAVSSQVSENAIIMPDRVDWDTEQASASVIYKLKKVFVTFGYYGSFFNNHVKSMTWQDVNDPTKSATMASAPSNQFNQFNLSLGYKISPKIKLVVTGSYGRSTQNDTFLDPSTASNGQLAFGLPVASLNGLVVSSKVNAKLTASPSKKWNFSAAYKFDNRDNQTPVNIFLFQDANESKSGVSPFAGIDGLPANLGSNTNIYNNRAYSRQVNQLNLQGERSVGKRQYLEAGYDWQRIGRSCTDSWINCADAPVTNENTLRAEWRTSRVGNFNARLGYAYSWRRGKYDEDAFLALVPMANFVPAGGATTSVLGYLTATGLTGFGPLAGLPPAPLTGNASIFSPNNNIVPQSLYGSRNNINELVGMRRYMVADRNRHKVRSSLDWQASEKFSLQSTGDFNFDDYMDSIYGLQKATSWAASVDLTYVASDNLVADLFYTYDNQRYLTAGDAYGSNSTATFQGQAGNTIISGGCFTTIAARNANAKMDPCLNWSKNSRDKIDSAGFVIRMKNLMSGKLELTGEAVYTRARTDTAVNGGSYVNNPFAQAAPAPPLPAGTPAVFFIPATNYPTLRNDEITLRPSFTYTLTKAASLRVFYMFQRLSDTDWAYAGLQFGTGTNYLPTNERVPTYKIHAAGVSLIYTF
ncbi:MAG: MtrB/PioB family outer membrane beta-barrel protein [Acidobacteriia bacterium]|nr:MtrB/PioB family outer membrane beta-barrel protein [Terriglobia bacterium]